MAEGADRVVFDFDGSLRLARTLYALSVSIEDDASTRAGNFTIATAKWEGAYGVEFVGRRDDEITKESNVVAQLRGEADLWAQAWAGAMDQQNKNNRAARVTELAEEKRDDRSLLEKGTDGLGISSDESWQEANDEVPMPAPVAVPVAPHYTATAQETTY